MSAAEVETLYVAGIRRLNTDEIARVGGPQVEAHYQALELEGEAGADHPFRCTVIVGIETPWTLGDWFVISRKERVLP